MNDKEKLQHQLNSETSHLRTLEKKRTEIEFLIQENNVFLEKSIKALKSFATVEGKLNFQLADNLDNQYIQQKNIKSLQTQISNDTK